MVRKLQRRGIGFNVLSRRKLGVLQINLHDPDGNHIELAYPGREIAALPRKYQAEGGPVVYEPPRQRAA